MKLLTVRFFLSGTFLSCALLPFDHAQLSATSAQAAQLVADPIVGAWKLDIDKSTNPTAEAEILAIVPQGDQFKLTFVATQSNRYNPHYEVVTDMKGMIAKPTDSGRPMNDCAIGVRASG